MALSQDGVNIVITGDASQAVQAIQQAESALDGLKDQTIDVKVDGKVDALGRLHKANGQFMTMGEKLAANFSSGFIKEFAEISVKLSDYGKKFESVFGTAFKSISAAASSVAGTISFITRNALAIGGGFEAQMTSVKVISGATADELAALTAKAREMGATLPITAKDAATAMTLLAQRGNDANKILASVNAVANLSISQAVDMGSAADLLGSTITNFAMSVDEAEKITAVFNNACNQSALSMSKLIEAMKYVGPAAGAVNMGLTEAVSAMEAVANAGLTGEMIGSGLSVVLGKLAKDSKIFGVETQNLDGSLRSISDTFSEFKQKGLTLADFIAAFGQRGAKVALALTKNSDTLKLNEERLKQWSSTQDAVNEKMKTFTNTLNAFQSASEELHIEIFDQIKEQAKDTVGSVAELTRVFSQWVGETQVAGQALNAFLQGLGFNIPSTDDFKKILDNLDLQRFIDSVQSFGTAIKNIADSIVSMFNMIKTPLAFLIEHLGLFATISFWGWILGKGLQVPAAILAIASSFKQLYAAGQLLLSLNWGLLLNPVTAAIGGAIVLGSYTVSKLAEAREAEDEFERTIARIQEEIRQADHELKLNIDIQTGFEKLPEAYIKASDEVRKSVDELVAHAQEAFKKRYARAIDYVLDKFPQLSEQAINSGNDILNGSKEIFSKLSTVLHGDTDAFKALPEILQKVVEHINIINMSTGRGNLELAKFINNINKLKSENVEIDPKIKFEAFSMELSESIQSVFDKVNEAKKYLNSPDNSLTVNVSLEQAKDSLDKFVKSISKKYDLSKLVVKEGLISKLKEIAKQGNDFAQSLIYAWSDTTKPIDQLLASAKEAVHYLGESPKKFLNAFNSIIKGIQKIDPVTGKLTEQFKKAHDALKEWANVTFDNLTNRIQKLRKAVEGGFIDQSVLEKEFKTALPQIKLQVVSELETSKSQFSSQTAYQSVIASELVSKVSDLFGDLGNNLLRNLYSGQSGSEIGRSILNEIQRNGGFGNNSQGFISINGIEQVVNRAVAPINADFKNFASIFGSRVAGRAADLSGSGVGSSQGYISINGIEQAVNKAVTPMASNFKDIAMTFGERAANLNRSTDSILGLINSIQTPTSSTYQSNDWSQALQTLSAIHEDAKAHTLAINNLEATVRAIDIAAVIQALNSIHDAAKDNSSSSHNIEAAVKAVDMSPIIQTLNALLEVSKNNSSSGQNLEPINESAISQAIINSFNPLISSMEHSCNVVLTSNDNVSKNLLSLAAYIDELKKAVDNNSSALSSYQNSYNPTGENQNFSSAIAPLTAVVSNLHNSLASLLNLQQANSNYILDALNALRNLDTSLKSLRTGNNYDIDIIQQGFSVASKADADYTARSAVQALRSGFGNGGV